MKKRAKLFTTIASLCLAVALMAFGVYAATSAKFNISGTVSFTAQNDVYLEYSTVSLFKSSTLGETDPTKFEEASMPPSVDSWTTLDDKGVPLAKVPDGSIEVEYAFSNASYDEEAEETTPAIYAYKLRVEFIAKANMTNLTVTLKDTATETNINYASSAECGQTKTVEGTMTIANVTEGASIIVTIVCSLKDEAVSITAPDVATLITFTR